MLANQDFQFTVYFKILKSKFLSFDRFTYKVFLSKPQKYSIFSFRQFINNYINIEVIILFIIIKP